MKEETYAFIEDVKERKSQARSAANKKNGSKSKKCTLPSDYLSKKEREKMNGEVKTWDLNKFYTWQEFRKMPRDIQVAYISTISQKYKVGYNTIGKCQFGTSNNYLYLYLHRKGMDKEIKLCKEKTTKDSIASYSYAIEQGRSSDLIFGKDESIDVKTNRIMPDPKTKRTYEKVKKVKDEEGNVLKIRTGEYVTAKTAVDYSNNPDRELVDIPAGTNILSLDPGKYCKPKASIDSLDLTLTFQSQKFDAEVFNKIAAMFDDEEVRVYMHIRKVNRSKKSADVV